MSSVFFISLKYKFLYVFNFNALFKCQDSTKVGLWCRGTNAKTGDVPSKQSLIFAYRNIIIVRCFLIKQ